MKFKIFYCLLFCMTLACSNEEKHLSDSNHSQHTHQQTIIQESDTKRMISELQELVANGSARVYYHWNGKRADYYRSQINQVPQEQKAQFFFNYCIELINAGKQGQAIQELTKYYENSGGFTAKNLSQKTKSLYRLLALAYLRQGEIDNCQNNHTPASCILPLKKEAYHELKEGSQKAIELYELILSKFPEDSKSQWLLNLAYMTLGQHPNKVPKQYLITFPNWKTEQKNFPAFKDIAMNVGVAENGLSGGTCVDDFNNDGYLDIFATSYGMEDQVKLFFNDQKGGFTDATVAAGLKGISSGLNVTHADYNNDGFRDILILRGAWLKKAETHPNSLLKNNGDGTFSDVSYSSKIISRHPTQVATWADYNNDGFLDVFIGNESERGNIHLAELFKNNGDGTFIDVASELGIAKFDGYIKGADWGDINNDGWPDLYVSLLNGANHLLKNNKGRFENISASAGVEKPISSFPTWFWDFNQDGFEDIFVSGYDVNRLKELSTDYANELMHGKQEGELCRLYKNNGDETFTEVSKQMGINKTMYAMGSNFGDLDNDGYFDFYVGTGAPDLSSVVPNRMFRNVNGQKFEEVTSAGGFGHIQKGHGIAFADLDNDGDQDIYAVMGGAFEGDVFTNVLFENPGFERSWIAIDLVGKKNNRDGIGAKIKVETDQQSFYHYVSTGGSFGSASLRQEIGLDKASTVKKITIDWPDGQKQIIENISINQFIKIEEGSNQAKTLNLKKLDFRKSGGTHHHHH